MNNKNIFEDISAIELFSVYSYAEAGNQELYERLYAGESDQGNINWQNIIHGDSIILENIIDESTIEFSIVSLHHEKFTNTIVATATLEHDGESWKVISQERKDIN